MLNDYILYRNDHMAYVFPYEALVQAEINKSNERDSLHFNFLFS